VTVRDIMQMPDFKVLDPRHHAYARTVLPITEGQIKNQEWEGKDHSKDKMGDARNDIQRNKVETQGTEHSHAKDGHAYKGKLDRQSPGQKLPESEASPAERAFADAVIAETHVVLSMKNNLGKPHGPLQLLMRDAWRQLESRISVDDQATPDNWIPRSEKLLRLTGKHPSASILLRGSFVDKVTG
jgi:nitrate reductase (NAD(P)H)